MWDKPKKDYSKADGPSFSAQEIVRLREVYTRLTACENSERCDESMTLIENELEECAKKQSIDIYAVALFRTYAQTVIPFVRKRMLSDEFPQSEYQAFVDRFRSDIVNRGKYLKELESKFNA